MSHERENTNAFRDSYELPIDQFSAELAFRDQFKATFPDQIQGLNYDLAEIQRQAGIRSPLDYELVDEDQEMLIEGSHGELIRFILESPVDPMGSSDLVVNSPDQVSQEEYDELDDMGLRIAKLEHDGNVVVGMPSHTRALLEGIFSITGAQTLRDDRLENGLERGSVIRQGNYMGVAIYFSEDYDDNWLSTGQPTVGLRLMGEGLASIEVTALTNPQKEKFATMVGVSELDILGFMIENKIDRDNYLQVGQNIAEARQIISSIDT